jgi:hypothetical protein
MSVPWLSATALTPNQFMDLSMAPLRTLCIATGRLSVAVALALTIGCATAPSTKMQLDPKASSNQSITYDRGQAQVQTEGSNPVRLTLVDHAEDQILLHLRVEDRGDAGFLFSEQSVSGEIVSSSGTAPIRFYAYEDAVELVDDSDAKLAAEAGSTAVSVGSRVVPYGGTIGSLAQLAMVANAQNSGDPEARLDALTRAAIANNRYIRRNSMNPGGEYDGLLRAQLPEPLETCESLRFQVQAGTELHRFEFECSAVEG